MRELERTPLSSLTPAPTPPQRVAVVGSGRTGTLLAAGLRDAGVEIVGPLGRGAAPKAVDAVLLCVPDSEIAGAASAVPVGPLVGHCSGATSLEVLAPHEGFSVHPLMTIATGDRPSRLKGAGAAIAGATPRALATADSVARALGMTPVRVADEDRAAYHAAASIAANFLVTLEAGAERLAAGAGIDRLLLAPLVRAAVENWVTLGPQQALTGPVARGDEPTVALQREAVSQRTPELMALFDALVDATRSLASPAQAGGHAQPGISRPDDRMRTIRTVAELRRELAGPRREGRRIGLVPTMGALHEGHLSLIARARAQCDLVVVSLFVNPAQFDDGGDLSRYPRDERRDAGLARELGADLLFAPAVSEVYPPDFATSVAVSGLSERLEGEHRGAAHFDGVATVVTKLLNMVGPDVAYFGQKDAQQLAVIRRLVSDLDLPVHVEAGPTVRAADGLALSSRNALLSAAQRERAPALHRALRAVQDAIRAGERDLFVATRAGLAELAAVAIEPDYLEIVDPATMLPASSVDGDLLVLVAARLGSTRLIDNILIEGGGEPPPRVTLTSRQRALTVTGKPPRPEVLRR